MNTAESVAQAATKFYNELKDDENGRYRSWEYCYYNFYKARNEKEPNIDHLSLQLAFYLASWGMYRGSSFLLQKDYGVHIPAVKELLQKKYDVLFGADFNVLLNEDHQKTLQELNDFLVQYYDGIRRTVKGEVLKNKISSTLIAKVLMGTLGCVPAYDRYFIEGIKSKKVAIGNYSMKSLSQLAEFYKENSETFESVRKNYIVEDIPYPQMKILDMGFWQIGEEN